MLLKLRGVHSLKRLNGIICTKNRLNLYSSPFFKGPDDTKNIDKNFTNYTPKEIPGNPGNMSPAALEKIISKGRHKPEVQM